MGTSWPIGGDPDTGIVSSQIGAHREAVRHFFSADLGSAVLVRCRH
jgi:hypothetical protein